jgi:hypothetical protein
VGSRVLYFTRKHVDQGLDRSIIRAGITTVLVGEQVLKRVPGNLIHVVVVGDKRTMHERLAVEVVDLTNELVGNGGVFYVRFVFFYFIRELSFDSLEGRLLDGSTSCVVVQPCFLERLDVADVLLFRERRLHADGRGY